MKNMIKMLFVVMAMAAAAACSTDQENTKYDYTQDDAFSAFFASKGSNVEFAGDATGSQAIAVDVFRQNCTGAATVALEVAVDDEYASMFTIPTSVNFADGEFSKQLEVVVNDASALEKGAEYSVVLTFAASTSDTTSTITKNLTYTLNVSVALEYNLMGVGTYTDDLVGGIFGADPVTYEVEVYTATGIDGKYFLKNAYTSEYPYNDPGDYVEEDVMFTIDARDPNRVIVPIQDLGLDWGYGMISVATVAPGTLANGVITFPAQAFYLAMSDYNGGAWSFYGNSNGAFKLVLPK